jgi:uncharacterized membrane protein
MGGLTFLLAFHWTWFVAAAIVGLAMGWIAVVHRGNGGSWKFVGWTAAVVAGLIVLSLVRLVPGRPGYWLDLGLLMFAVYVVGCVAGSLLRGFLLSRQQAIAAFRRMRRQAKDREQPADS